MEDFVLSDVDEVVRRIGNDILRSWDLIATGVAIAFTISLTFLIFFRFPSSMPTVIAVFSFLILFLLGAISYFLYVEEDRVYDLLYGDWEGVEMEGTERNIHTRIY